MKKIEYKTPEMEVVELNSKSALLAGSVGTEIGGGGGGGFAPEFVIMDDDIKSTN